MRRHSRAGGKSPNAHAPKAAARKRRIAPKAVRRPSSSVTRLEIEVAGLTRERDELLEQQAATSEVLGVISRSKFELRPTLQSVVETAARLCRAEAASIFRLDSGVYRWAVGHDLDAAYLEIEQQTPIPPGPGTVVGRAALSRKVARIDDAWTDPFYEKKGDAKIGAFSLDDRRAAYARR
jgi:hypothetical protein